MLLLFLISLVFSCSLALNYSTRNIIGVALPRRIGQSAVVDWCKDGVAGALQNTITRLFQEKLSVAGAQRLRDSYVGNASLVDELTYALPDLAALFGQRLAGVPNLLAGKPADPDMNNLIALTRLLPVFKDMLNLPDNADVGLKLRTFTDNVCRFFDLEHESKIFKYRTPFSCAIIDAIQSGVACGAARFVVRESCEPLPRVVPLQGFPNVSCAALPESLQRQRGQLSEMPFDWEDPNLVLQVPLVDILDRFHGVVPDYIPTDIRDSEMLTYLILYRAEQIIYAAQTEGWSPKCPNANLFDKVELIPGWKTLQVFAVAEPVDEPSETPATIPFPNWITKWLIKAVGERGAMRIQQMTGALWDDSAQRAAAIAVADLRELLRDPFRTWRAIADIQEVFAHFAGIAPARSTDIRAIVKVVAQWLQESPDRRATDLQTIQVPTVFISQDPMNPCHLAIGCRGTTSFHEWILDFNYWASPDPNINVLHRGVQDFLSGLLPPLRLFLETHSAKHNCTCANTEFTFYGHSLGGGLAQQLSVRVSKWFDFHRWDMVGRRVPEPAEIPKCPLKIHNVLFAPLKQLDARTRFLYRRRINTRAILDLNDPLTYVPCHQGNGLYGYPRCGRGHLGYAGFGRDYFVEHPGVLFLNVNYKNVTKPLEELADTLSEDDTSLSDMKRLPRSMVSTVFNSILPASIQARLPNPQHLVAAHICAHSCALSAACTSGDFEWWCRDCPN